MTTDEIIARLTGSTTPNQSALSTDEIIAKLGGVKPENSATFYDTVKNAWDKANTPAAELVSPETGRQTRNIVEQTIGGVGQMMKTIPFVNPTAVDALTAANQGLGDVAYGATTPLGVATIPASLVRGASRLIAGAFVPSMIEGTVQSAQDTAQKIAQGDVTGAIRSGIGTIGSLGMATAATSHAFGRTPRATVATSKPALQKPAAEPFAQSPVEAPKPVEPPKPAPAVETTGAPVSVPETESGNIGVRKSFESAESSPWMPEQVREAVKVAPERFYNEQSDARVKDVVQSMTDTQLASVPSNVNIWTGAQMEKAKRLFNDDNDAAAFNVFADMARQGTTWGQLINQFKQLGGINPAKIVSVLDMALQEAKFDPLPDTTRAKLIQLASAEIKERLKFEAAQQEYLKTHTDDAFTKVEQAEKVHESAQLEFQRMVHKFTPRTLPSMLKAVLQGNLLAPISQAANAVGNIAFLPPRMATRTVAAAADALDSYLQNKPREQTVSPITGSVEAVKAALGSAPAMAKIATQGLGDVIKGEKRPSLHPLRAWAALLSKNPELPTRGGKLTLGQKANLAIEGTFGAPAEVMLRGLAMMDAPFRAAAHARAVTEQAKLAGLPKEKLAQAIRFPELFFDSERLRTIKGEADAAVFQRESKTVRHLNSLIASQGPWADFWAATIMPYKVTPWNIVGEILSYNPLVATALSGAKALKGDSRAAKLYAGKAVVGSTLSLAAAWLYKKGITSPSYDDSDESLKLKINAGKVLPPNSLNLSALTRAVQGGDSAFKAGDQTIDLQRGGGLVGSILVMMANIGRELEKGRTGDDEGLLWNVLKDSTLEQAKFGVSQSFLKGAAGLLEALRTGRGDSFLMNWINSLQSIPLPNTLAALSRAQRKYKIDTKPQAWHEFFSNAVKTRLGITGLADQFPLKRDYFGRPMPETPKGRNPWVYHLIDIGRGQAVTSDPIDLELYRLARSTGNSAIIPSIPEREQAFFGKRYVLNPQQYEKLSAMIGQQRLDLANRMVGNPNFMQQNDKTKTGLLTKLYSGGAELAKMRFWQAEQGNMAEKKKKAGFGGFSIESKPPQAMSLPAQ